VKESGGHTPRPLTTEGREQLFGRFAFKRNPAPDNPEAITITDGWDKRSLVRVRLDLLGGIDVRLHRLAAPRVVALIAAWKAAGVLDDVVSWDGAYAPRLVRGTTQGTLSAHAFGSAIDINARYNRLGCAPAPLGAKGCVLRLVPIAEAMGFYWGGRFARKDGMHFEVCQLG
jgi:hypothetical protein